MPALPEIRNPSYQHGYPCFQLLSVKKSPEKWLQEGRFFGPQTRAVYRQISFNLKSIISIAGCVLAYPEMLAGQHSDCLQPCLDYFDHKLFWGSVLAMCLPHVLAEGSLWSVFKHQNQTAVAPELQLLCPTENIWGNPKPALRLCCFHPLPLPFVSPLYVS